MTFRRSVSFVALLASLAAILALSAPSAQADPVAPPGTPTAVTFDGVPSVGAIFDHGLTKAHGCSASVVRSPGRDLVLTAAHCVSGTGAGMLFVPGYLDGNTPYGVWTVQRAWVSPTWVASQDPHNDYAFLQVAPQVIGGRQVRRERMISTGSYSL